MNDIWQECNWQGKLRFESHCSTSSHSLLHSLQICLKFHTQFKENPATPALYGNKHNFDVNCFQCVQWSWGDWHRNYDSVSYNKVITILVT